MANIGHFLGGAAREAGLMADEGIRRRALGLQERSLQRDQMNDLATRADEAITNTIGLWKSALSGIDLTKYGGVGTIAQAIAQMETGGVETPYTKLHPVTASGDRAVGKYGIMTFNIPVWTEEVLNKRMTVDEFLRDPVAQDTVAIAKLGQYLADSGGDPRGAALKWFAGPNGTLRDADILGTTGADYIEKFTNILNELPQQELRSQAEPFRQEAQGLMARAQAAGLPINRNLDLEFEAANAEALAPLAQANITGAAAGQEMIAKASTLAPTVGRERALQASGVPAPTV